MNLISSEFLPEETRITFSSRARQKLPTNLEIMKKLGIHRNTANSWLRGEYNPSIEQLKQLGLNIMNYWEDIESIHLEGGTKKFKIPKYLPIKNLSWIQGILDGDRAGKPEDGIGISNQDVDLIKTFMDMCTESFGITREDFIVEIFWDESQHIHKQLGISKHIIREYPLAHGLGYKSNKPLIRAILYNRIISRILENFRDYMAKQGNDKLKSFAWYVKGLMDSDGGFVKKNICLQQKTLDNLKIVEKIIDVLNIQHGGIRKPDIKKMYRLYIFSKRSNLKRYNDYIGFFSKPKLRNLQNILS